MPAAPPPAYAELQVLSNFSFLEGASHAAELIIQAKELGLQAIGIADRNTLAGIVRAHKAAKEHGMRLLVGARLDLLDGASLIAYPEDRDAYGRLSQLITLGRRRAEKGTCDLYQQDVIDWGQGLRLIALPPAGLDDVFRFQLDGLHQAFPNHLYLAASHLLTGVDQDRIQSLSDLAAAIAIPLIATNDVIMHSARRRALADVLSCVREKTTIDRAGLLTQRNGERHLKSPDAMAKLFQGFEDALASSLEIVEACSFSLDELAYEYPDEIAEPGVSTQTTLEKLVWAGSKWRHPGGMTQKTRTMLEHELELIGQLKFAPYFLTVYDLVKFARSRDILCQGRGSAANSAVCFMLGITSIDPVQSNLLFERFISAERGEPPDIDVDFEHERREEVIQYVYEKYGRHRAGMTAVVSRYRTRGAIRDVGKAMGLSEDTITLISSQTFGWINEDDSPRQSLIDIGLDPNDMRLRQTILLIQELIGFPRHLGQHVGGLVITRGRLDAVVPIENAAMEDRTVVQWDKDDLDALGILKIDVLSLGMLSCIRKCFDMIRSYYGRTYDMATIPQADGATFDMLCEADAIGVFQVESRAQLSFLPRMKPRSFYDLVIEVAIVRPGPIQGDMVHPYLRRRNGEEPVSYPSEGLRQVLHKTLGVPLFQEQAMKIAIVGAGFSPAESDQLRRAMATFRNAGTIGSLRDKFIKGMLGNGYQPDFAERCFKQIEGFGEYGFPESHAASFALLVYVSAWMKCHYPAAFACALLNSQPMGFYAPAQIVSDARNHDIPVLPADVNASDWDCTLESHINGYALRLGLRMVKGLSADDGGWVVAARGNGYQDPFDIWRRAGVGRRALNVLARADTFQSLGFNRREALWKVKSLGGDKPLPLFDAMGEFDQGPEAPIQLPPMNLGEEVVADYASLRLSLKAHPMEPLRPHLPGVLQAQDMMTQPNGKRVHLAGLVLARQRPGTARGVVFVTLEDETGTANLIVWSDIFERYRRDVFTARLLKIQGRLQREGIVTHVIVETLENYSWMLDELAAGTVPDQSTDTGTTWRTQQRQNPFTSPPPPQRGHPRDNARRLFPSRDFH